MDTTRTTPAPPDGALVLVSASLLLELAEKANPDVTFSVEWGEPELLPITYVYNPAFTRHEPESA